MKRTAWLWLLPLLLGSGCGLGGQTGGEVKDSDNDGTAGEFDQCEETSLELGGADEESPLGFSARGILDFSVAEHVTSTEWKTPIEPVISNASGSTELTVDVAYAGGSVRYVDSMQKPTMGEGPAIAVDPDGACPDRLEIDVEVQISTTDGRLSESATATLRARNPWVAELSVPLDPAQLSGSLELDTDGGSNPKLTQFRLEAQLSEGLFQGSLGGTLEQHDDQVASAGFFELLAWGEAPCSAGDTPVPVESGLLPARSMLDVVNDHGPLSLTWKNGDQAELSFSVTSDAEWACLQSSSDLVVLNAELAASSDDGRIDSTLGVELIGTPDPADGFEQVQLLFNAYFAKAVAASEFEQAFGIHGADVSAFESATISFGTIYDLSGDAVTARGELEVLGLTSPNCPENPEPQPDPDGGGSSSPGCPGIMSTVVDSATW